MPAYKLIEFKDITQKDTKCSICLENFSIENDQQNNMHVCITSCKHYFHKKCIDDWFKNEERCPLCKTSFGERRQRPEDNFNIGEFLNNEQNINPPEPVYSTQLNPRSLNREAFFQDIVDRYAPSTAVSLEALQTAIEDATTSYLTWRGDGRGVYHRGNTGKDRALNFYLQITRSNTHNNDVVTCWRYICNTIRNYPRHNHSYTSFVLNSLKTINGLRLRAIDYTSSDNEARNERYRLLDGGLLQMNVGQREQRRLKAIVYGNPEGFRLFWRVCFNEALPNTYSTAGLASKSINLQHGDRLTVWLAVGQERFRTITRNTYRGANIIFVVGDAGEVRDFASRIRDNNSIPVIWVELSN